MCYFTYERVLIAIAITAQWIDPQFTLCQALIQFVEFDTRHTGVNMARYVYETLESYGLKEKLFCVTSDNASNNDTMVESLEERLREYDGIVWDSKALHIRCLAHVINLVTQSLTSTLTTGDGTPFTATLTKIRELAKASRHGSKRPALFREACEEKTLPALRIPLDIAVRWNSTFKMLETAIYLRSALERFAILSPDLTQHKLSAEEWNLAETLFMILVPFKRLSLRFESNEATAEIDYVFYAYETMFNHLEDVKATLNTKGRAARRNAELIAALNAAYNELLKYYGFTSDTYVYGDANILNPRCKVSIFGLQSWQDVDRVEYVSKMRERFKDGYCNEGEREVGSQDNSNKRSHAVAFPEDEIEQFRANIIQRMQEANHQNGLSEFEKYIKEDIASVKPQKVLDWWKENARKYPILSKMARDYLAVPASGSSVEREFSVSGRIATWARNRLKPSTIANAMMYKSALRKSHKWETKLEDEDDEWTDDEYEGNDSSIVNDTIEDSPKPSVPVEWLDGWWKTNTVRASISASRT
jgi:hypothetical protein